MVICRRCAPATLLLALCMTACGGGKGNSAPVNAPSVPVYAFEAPHSNDATRFNNFTANILPHIAGPGFTIGWAMVDDCSPTGPCTSESQFDWSLVDGDIMGYINNSNTDFNSGCNGQKCKIVLIIQPTSDAGNMNKQTPQYAFSPTYAASLGAAPQDVTICNTMQGGPVNGIAAPITSPSGLFNDDYAIWNADGGSILAGSDLAITGSFPTSNFSGFPVVYEKPFVTAYENFIHNLLLHFSSSGSGAGPTIAPYIAYIRFGYALGGEDDQVCALAGPIAYADWKPSTIFPAGYLVQPATANPGNYAFVSNGSGTSAASAPGWCQTAYCNTSADGSISGWRNTGNIPAAPLASNVIWPGPEGEKVEPRGFSYNGYLSTWGDTDGAGYVTVLSKFIAGQKSSLPIVISSHTGTPFNSNWNFADSEAIIAVGEGMGFGMESLNITDPLRYAADRIPNSGADWAENFNVFANSPAVRFLQAEAPGAAIPGAEAEQFPISNITVSNGMAVATCTGPCNAFCGGPVYIASNANASLNNTWMASTANCNSGTISFPAPAIAPGSFAGGTMYAADYLPITIPFARARHATAIELHECTLDYAFGTQAAPFPCYGSSGPDANYQSALAQQ